MESGEPAPKGVVGRYGWAAVPFIEREYVTPSEMPRTLTWLVEVMTWTSAWEAKLSLFSVGGVVVTRAG